MNDGDSHTPFTGAGRDMDGEHDPLFDPSLPGDETLARLESALRPHEWQPRPLVLPDDSASGDECGPASSAGRGLPWALAAALLLMAVLAVSSGRAVETSYPLVTLFGVPRVESSTGAPRGPLRDGLRLHAGERIVCDDDSAARLLVPGAGQVELGPGTRLLALPSEGDGWRLALERGQLSASIFAAPGLFAVGTPAGLALDLGCVYTARVADDGSTELTVRGGLVSFEGVGRTVFVPEGAVLFARPGERPGTPRWLNDNGKRVAMLREVDRWAALPEPASLSADQHKLLSALLVGDSPRDGLSPWHLLDHPWRAVRQAACEHLTDLFPPPAGSTCGAIVDADAHARAEWRAFLSFYW